MSKKSSSLIITCMSRIEVCVPLSHLHAILADFDSSLLNSLLYMLALHL